MCPSGMFFEPTAIHDDEQAGLLGESGSRIVHNALLQPHGLRAFGIPHLP